LAFVAPFSLARPAETDLMAKPVKIFHEPRWPAFVAIFATALVHQSLPERLSVGPRWGLVGVVAILLVPMILSYHRGHYNVSRILTFTATGVITLAMIASLALLVTGIPKHLDSPQTLLRSAISLWITNVFVFALWYWKLDAGGPIGRDKARGDFDSSFLFPQMIMRDEPEEIWSPQFLDYLFLAFNTSTAFSPTDTAVLSRWAKLTMMLQSIISLMIVTLLAARAVGIL
jgi:uncharacterized membrane protein